jgi:hypothetical protein
MASVITVTIKYTDNSKSLKESFSCADTNPSADVIKDCESQMRTKWAAMGGQLRDTQTHTVVNNYKIKE